MWENPVERRSMVAGCLSACFACLSAPRDGGRSPWGSAGRKGSVSMVGEICLVASPWVIEVGPCTTENRGVTSSTLALGTNNTGARSPRAEVAQLVEHHLAKVRVAGSSPVFRSISSPR